MTSWQIYWLTRLDAFQEFFGLLAGLILVVSVITTIVWGAVGEGKGEVVSKNSYGEQRKWKAQFSLMWCISGYVLSLIMFLCASATPSSKEMAAIILVPKMVNAVQSNEKLTQIPGNVLDLANAWIEELKPKENK